MRPSVGAADIRVAEVHRGAIANTINASGVVQGIGLMFVREVLTRHGMSYKLAATDAGDTRFDIGFPPSRYSRRRRAMPAISVTIDGKELATVALSDVTLLSVHVNALRWNDEFGTVYMDGGDYTDKDASPYRIWINELPLAPGQIVRISFVTDAPTTVAGKTIEELFPDEPRSSQTDFTPTDADFAEVSSRPMLRDGYAFTLNTSKGAEHAGRTDPGEYGLSLRTMWASLHRPESVRFSVTTNNLEQLRTRSPARERIKGELGLGQSLQFELGPVSASD